MPECGTIDLAWSNLEQVAEYQTDASANAVRRAIARANGIERCVHADLVANGSIHNQEYCATTGARGRSMEKKRFFEHCGQRSNDNREVHR